MRISGDLGVRWKITGYFGQMRRTSEGSGDRRRVSGDIGEITGWFPEI